MSKIVASLLATAATIGMLAAFAQPVLGKNLASHEMTIQLPGGGSETIRYTGDVAPEVRFVRGPFDVPWSAPLAIGLDPSFAAVDRTAADMERRLDAFWRQPQAIMSWPTNDNFSQADLKNFEPGMSAYSMVSQSFGNNVCTRVTEITTGPNGGKPRVVSQTSGKCGASPAGAPATGSNSEGTKPIADRTAVSATRAIRTAL